MRRLAVTLLSSVALIAAASAASAADLPMKAPAYVPAPAFSWTGFYIGGNVGYGWGETKGDAALPLPGNFDIDGVLGGVQGGVNYQIQNWVIGLEVDYQWASIDGDSTAGIFTDSAKVSRFGTVRGRLGYAWDRWMVYGTGGWAFAGRMNYSFVTPLGISDSADLSGWTAGGGVEYAFAPGWSAKLEYLHVNLDDKNFGALCAAGCSVGSDIDVVRVGLNYRFGSGFGPGAWR